MSPKAGARAPAKNSFPSIKTSLIAYCMPPFPLYFLYLSIAGLGGFALGVGELVAIWEEFLAGARAPAFGLNTLR